MSDDWRDIRRDANRVGRFGLGWVALIIAFVLIVGAIIWGVTVLTSQAKGAGDAVIEKNSAENWTAAQARFEGYFADIEATDRKITVAQEALAANPDDKTAQQTLAGTVNYCLSVVADYNAAARSYLSEDFRAADLPPQIDNSNPNTDCEG